MKKSENIGNIAAALHLFHVKVSPIKKDSENPFFKNKYASLSTILEQIETPLMEAGLVFSQMPDGDDQLTTLLIHVESGEYLESSYNITPVKRDPQAVGSAITYARRYALGALLGLNIEEDDDANAATQPARSTKDEKKWLNRNTPEFKNAVDKINAGEATLWTVQNHYKISNAVRAELEKLTIYKSE